MSKKTTPKGFVFYPSFLDALKLMNDNDRLASFDALSEFGVHSKPIKYEDFSDTVQIALHLIEPQISASKQNYVNGKKGAKYGNLGGAPMGNQNARKDKNNPENNPNNNKYKNINMNKKKNSNTKNDKDTLPPTPSNGEGKFVFLSPPSFEQVKAYAETRGHADLATDFFDWFSVREWHDSNGQPVRSWKGKFITWEKHNFKNKETNGNEKNNNPQEGQQNQNRRGNGTVLR